MQDATALDLQGAGSSLEGWVPFHQVGMLLDEPQFNERGYALVPCDASGFFDSIKKWVKKTAGKVAKAAKSGLATVRKGLSAALDSGIGQAAQNYLSLIPGYGTAAAAALGGLSSALKGNSWSQVLLDAAQKAVPGGKLGQTAFAAARGALEGALSGKGVQGALAGAASKALGTGLGVASKGISQVLGQSPEASGIDSFGAANALARAGRVREARGVAKQLVDRPELRALNTRQLATALGVSPAVAQAGQAAIYKFIAPTAPAFPAGVSLDAAGGFLGASAAPIVSTAIQMRHGVTPPPFRRFTPGITAMLPGLVPGLRSVDPQFVSMAANGPKPRVRVIVPNDARGVEGAKWRVSAGDFYAKIAAAMGHPNETLALIKANPTIKSPYTLFVGQLINLPEAWIGGMTPAPAPSPSPVPLPAPTTANTYTVQPGDTMQLIATKHGHPNDVGVLIIANPQVKDPSMIFPGDKLNIPAGWVSLGGKTPVPLPPSPIEIEVQEEEEPDWYIPGTNPGDYQLPDGTWESFPGEAYQAKLDTAVWARVQTELAAWNRAFPGACTPSDYGLPTDFTAIWDSRTQQAIASYQKWAKKRGEQMHREDGVLDDVTQNSLDRTFEAIVKGQTGPSTPSTPTIPPAPSTPTIPGLPPIPPLPNVPTPAPTPAPVPFPMPAPTPAPTKKDSGGSLLLALLPFAAALA